MSYFLSFLVKDAKHKHLFTKVLCLMKACTNEMSELMTCPLAFMISLISFEMSPNEKKMFLSVH